MKAIDTSAFSFSQLKKMLRGKKVRITYGNLNVTKKGTVRDVSDLGLVLESGVLRITPDISVCIYSH